MYHANRHNGSKYINELVLDSDVNDYVKKYFPEQVNEFNSFDSIVLESHRGIRKVKDYELAAYHGDRCYVGGLVDTTRIWKKIGK